VNSSSTIADTERVETFIADVLHRVYRTTVATGSPHDTRGVLYVAHCFADELAAANPHFDRLHFIQAATSES
jgi:hypothetical protein